MYPCIYDFGCNNLGSPLLANVWGCLLACNYFRLRGSLKVLGLQIFEISKNIYEGVSTSVRTQGVETDVFSITIGLRQGLTLRPYVFTLILNVLTEHIQDLAPKCMLFVDDIVILGKSKVDFSERLETSFRKSWFSPKLK